MGQRRVLAIGLDGFDIALAERFMAEGALPHLARLRNDSACYDLDHGRDKFSGLAWEHFSSGRAPRDGARWSAVTFDRRTYEVRQESTVTRPFMAGLSARTVIFDVPYCDLSHAPNVRGLTNWGAHDPGVAPVCRPESIRDEISGRFGAYPAQEWIYGFCWPSAAKTQRAADALTQAVALRSRLALWLFRERLPEWDFGVVVVSEGHSAIEPLWHGVDTTHALHGIESSPVAARGLREVYGAIDCLVGKLHEAFPDAALLTFAMHGMGQNESDVAAMALLPELLYRWAFGSAYMKPVDTPGSLPNGVPLLGENAHWDEALLNAVPEPRAGLLERLRSRIGQRFGLGPPAPKPSGVEWMPAARYSQFWPKMRAFALPSYYDGRVRINVAGREARGIVRPSEYRDVCDATAQLLNECRNLLTGEEVIAGIHRPSGDPFDVSESEPDLYIEWRSAPLGLSHPRLGTIGPVPYRRTGGHTGSRGFLYITGEGVAPGNHATASSFDVVPTILDLLNEKRSSEISGNSLLQPVCSPR